SDLGTFIRSGGTVNLIGTLINTGTTLSLTNSNGSWNLATGGVLLGGAYSGSASFQLFGAGGTLDGVTVNSVMTVLPLHTLNIADGATLNANITLGQQTLGAAILAFTGTANETISGTASIISGDDSNVSVLYNNTWDNISTGLQVTFGSGITFS